jgi:hypothetical protein
LNFSGLDFDENALWEQGVVGSNPIAPTNNKNKGLRFSRKPLLF